MWRGVSKRIRFTYDDYGYQTWWTITSTSKSMNIGECLHDETGTLYAINSINGRDVSQYAAIHTEAEVILMPGTRIYVVEQPLEVANRPLKLHYQEW